MKSKNNLFTKTTKKEIYLKFLKAIREFELIEDNDKIAVCISGGKDSLIMALCFKQLLQQYNYNFECKFIAMDPGYPFENLKLLKENAQKLNIDLTIFKTNVFAVASRYNQNSCYLCARMRRGYLYSKAQELGCNKIALGHHFNDVIETLLLNVLYNGQFSGMLPKVQSDNFPPMQLIRPLYYVKEDSIIAWSQHNNLQFLDCICPNATKQNGKRKEIKQLISELVKSNKNADINLYNSTININEDTLLGLHSKK